MDKPIKALDEHNAVIRNKLCQDLFAQLKGLLDVKLARSTDEPGTIAHMGDLRERDGIRSCMDVVLRNMNEAK